MLLFVVSFVKRPFVGGRFEAEGEPIRLYRRLSEAQSVAETPRRVRRSGRVFVLDGECIEVEERNDGPSTHAIPAEAVLNGRPYRPPVSIEAGGGYVVRMRESALELLLIFRRGCWDLPKGKRDEGEEIEACALREVAEEIGVGRNELRVLADLGTTVHGYTWPKKEAYAVKTTRWYAMATTATSFSPQTSEGIETAVWTPWEEAGDRLGYENLREHHAEIDPEWLIKLP